MQLNYKPMKKRAAKVGGLSRWSLSLNVKSPPLDLYEVGKSLLLVLRAITSQ